MQPPPGGTSRQRSSDTRFSRASRPWRDRCSRSARAALRGTREASRTAATRLHPDTGSTGEVVTAGSRLAGRYLLFEPIGAGGMATVWRGLDTRLRRPVAVKLLREPFADNPDFVERFEREARHAASLSHPNVATVFDTGRDGDARFIVMELADGPTVADVMRARGRLPLRRPWRSRLRRPERSRRRT